MDKVTAKDYPIYDHRPDLIKTVTGKSLDEITIDAILNDELSEYDVRISPEALEIQAQIAEDAGRWFVAANLRRAAELTKVPDDKVMFIYDALRPNRCTEAEMEAIARDLEENYGAKLNAELVREAAEAYKPRGFLNGEEE